MSPIAPHLSEELWSVMGNKHSIFDEEWPLFDQNFIHDDILTIVVQVNGKVRGKMEVKSGLQKDDVLLLAKSNKNVESYLIDKVIIKEIYIPDRLINFVIKNSEE